MRFNGGLCKGRVNCGGAVRKMRVWIVAERLCGGGSLAAADVEGEDFGDDVGSVQN